MRNKIFLSGLVTILLIGSSLFFYWRHYYRSFNEVDLVISQTQAEEEKNKNDNLSVINSVGQLVTSSVKSIEESDHIWGEINAPVQLIIYSDFACPVCADFSPALETLKNEFGDELVIAFRHFPLNYHQAALPAALASECAAEQGKFWDMHNKLFTLNQSRQMSISNFSEAARELELNEDKFNNCLDQEKYKDKVLEQVAAGEQAGVNGTPTIFINGVTLPGAYPLDDFVDADGKERRGLRTIIKKNLNI